MLSAISQLAVPPRLLGLGTSNVLAARALGALIGVSVTIAVFTGKLTTELPAKVAAAAVGAGL